MIQLILGIFLYNSPHLICEGTREPRKKNLWLIGILIMAYYNPCMIGKYNPLHPRRLTWNLRIHPWKRKIIFQTIIFRFYVFQGVYDLNNQFFFHCSCDRTRGLRSLYKFVSPSNRPFSRFFTLLSAHCFARAHRLVAFSILATRYW